MAHGYLLVCGSPAMVADFMAEWFNDSAVDDFTLLPAHFPEAFDDVIDLVIPELQRRGLFPEARELTERADQARISGEAMERVVSLARGIIDQLRNSKDVDPRTRTFMAAIEEGLVEPGWKITRAGFAAYVVTRNALIAIDKLLNWANSAFATVVGGIVLSQIDPGMAHTQHWIEFVLNSSQQILAFAEPLPELKIWLNAQIDTARADKEMRKQP